MGNQEKEKINRYGFSDLVIDVWEKLGGKSIVAIGLMFVTGLMEGSTTVLLLPLLKYTGFSGNTETDTITRIVEDVLVQVGLQPSALVILYGIILAFLVQYTVFLMQGWLSVSLSNTYVATWRSLLIRHALSAKWKYFTERKTGYLIDTVVTDTTRIGILVNVLIQVTSISIFAFIYIAIAFAVSWKVTLILIGTAVFLALLMIPINKRAYRLGRLFTSTTHEVVNYTNEYFNAAKLIKASATENTASDNFSQTAHQAAYYGKHVTFGPHLVRAIFEFIAATALAVSLVIGTHYLGLNNTTIIVVLALFFRLYPRLSTMQQNIQGLHALFSAFESVQTMFSEANENAEDRREPYGTLEHEKWKDTLGETFDLEIKDLVVKYDEKIVLDHMNLLISGGKTIGIVGESGAGKSTLADAILGLVETRSGTIQVNGMPMNEVPIEAWRRTVGYVTQETILFHDTIHKNIAWSPVPLTRDQVIKAAKLANAHEFIVNTEQGYDTVIGDRGVRLSGGQRQRLGLARALAGDIGVLILDEATSSLDSESEKRVMESVEAIRGTMTIIIIAHRLSTIRNADYIYVLDKGRVIEQGTWSELISGNKKFNDLWNLQSQLAL